MSPPYRALAAILSRLRKTSDPCTVEEQMKTTALGGLAILTVALTSSALAQGSGTIEFGLFGQASYFDKSLRFD